jgi:hypothetical protein
MLAFLRKQMQDALEARAALKTELDGILKAPSDEKRDLTADEDTAFAEKRDAIKAKDADIDALEARIAEVEAAEARDAKAAELRAQYGQAGPQGSGIRVTSEPETYRRDGNVSYFRDLYRAQVGGNRESIERLTRNDREVQAGLEQRALTTTDGGIGEFVPPLWMVDDYVKLARAGRVCADQVTPMTLPGGTDSINLPRLATGTATAEQTTQNTAVQNTDATTNSVTARWRPSPASRSSPAAARPVADQHGRDPAGGPGRGLRHQGSTRSSQQQRGEQARPAQRDRHQRGHLHRRHADGGRAVPKVADGIQQIHTGRFMPADKIFMHPRRWAWFTARLDTAGRPLVVPVANMPQNALANMGAVESQGFVGTLQGLPVYIDPNIPINLGGGTNEDRIIILRSTDVILFEGTPARRGVPRDEGRPAVGAAAANVYNYVARMSRPSAGAATRSPSRSGLTGSPVAWCPHDRLGRPAGTGRRCAPNSP